MGLHARERGKDPCPPRHGPVIRMVSAAALVVALVVGMLAGAATAQGTCGPLVGVPCTGGQCCRHVPQTCSPPPPTPHPRATKGHVSQHGLFMLIGVCIITNMSCPQYVCSGSQLSACAGGAGIFFSVADCQLAVHPLLAVPCLFAAPLASAVAQQTTAHHPAARGAGVPVTRLGRLLRPPPALPQPQHNQPPALLANDAPLAPLGPARLSGIV
jgi:hypothetical protein